MAKQPEQPSLAQLQADQDLVNSQFMGMTTEHHSLAIAEGNNDYKQAYNMLFTAPTLSGAWVTRIAIKHKIKVDITKGSGDAKLNAGAPYNFINMLNINFGSRVVTLYPYLTKVLAQMEGYNRIETGRSAGKTVAAIDEMLHKVPTTLQDGENEFTFISEYELNNLHPQSVEGILPIYGTGTRLSIGLQTANVFGSDPVDNVINLTGGATGEVMAGSKIDVVLYYRNGQSKTVTSILQPNMSTPSTKGSIQAIQLPTITPLGSNVTQYANLRTPMPFYKLLSIVVDGRQSDKFASAGNIKEFVLETQEDSRNAHIEYTERNGGVAEYYRHIRSHYGFDFDEGVFIAHDGTTENAQNVSAKASNYPLNLTSGGFASTRIGYKVEQTTDANGITPRVINFGIALNTAGLGIV